MSTQIKAPFCTGQIIGCGDRIAVVAGPMEPYKLWPTDEDGWVNGEAYERLQLPVVFLPPRTDGIPEYLDESAFDSYRTTGPAVTWPA